MDNSLSYEAAIAACARAGVEGIRAALRFTIRSLPLPYDSAPAAVQSHWRDMVAIVLAGRWLTVDINDRESCPGFHGAVLAETERHPVLASLTRRA